MAPADVATLTRDEQVFLSPVPSQNLVTRKARYAALIRYFV
jgi:hypothetical protein